jgi:adenine-specific DNA-methyltransferase
VTPELDREKGVKAYAYDPHLDPQLQWSGKAEHTSFEVPTVSLHVHERIDPRTIIEAVRNKNTVRIVDDRGIESLKIMELGRFSKSRRLIGYLKNILGWKTINSIPSA